MKTIKAKWLTAEGFKAYGNFFDVVHPQGNNLGTFYQDHILFPVSGMMPVGFSALKSKKPERMLVTQAEYHNTTCEGILALDDDVIIHVAPPSSEPVPQLTEAFYVPKGTMVALNVGVWHLAPFPVHKDEVHLLIALPERTYYNDCTVVSYDEKDYMEIELA